MHRLFTYLDSLPKSLLVVFGTLLVVLLGFIDYVTGPDLSVFIFYLVPVSIGTWYVGIWAGIVFSILSALAWSLAADLIGAGTILPYWNLAVEVGFFLIVTYILAALKATLMQERNLARTDHLTGATNGRYFKERVCLEIERACRYGRPLTALYADLDNFKQVNDTLGHQAGDQLLQVVVRTMRENVRSTDIVARVGGDEFVILFPETGYATAEAAAAKVLQSLRDVMGADQWPVTFSAGIVTFITPPRSVDHLIQLTDEAMYKAKNSGKNRVCHERYEDKCREADGLPD